MTRQARLTKHQKWVLDRLTYMSGADKRWVAERDCGSAGGLRHLFDKGYADMKVERGPLGGEHRFYRVASGGMEQREKRAEVSVGVVQNKGEIDSRLIEARAKGQVVRIFVGPKPDEFRGVPGEVARDADGVVRMQFGMRRVALKGISRVVVD